MKTILMSAALAAAGLSGALSGCTGLNADVHATNLGAVHTGAVHTGDVHTGAGLQGERTYAIARLPSPGAADAGSEAAVPRAPYEALLRDELAKYGLTPQTGPAMQQHAHYIVSIAHDTRPADVRVNTAPCPEDACSATPAPPFALFGGQVFQHSLTLRFFERTSGQEVYKVSAASSDRDADPLHAMPLLVKSAMAKFPFAAPADWRVKLRAGQAGGAPDVVSVKPLVR